MAKQTFSVGQVLTAAQMTSLQQTAMLGGAASAKTTSYTLVAADAGSAISMTSTSATTITVNTGLFAAGDTVQITNLGAGVCTITAGTATVNTSASLALAQYESGTLDFTSTSAAIFIKGAGATATSGGMTLLATTTLSGSSTTISSLDQTYVNLFLVGNIISSSDCSIQLYYNGDTTSGNYNTYYTQGYGGTFNHQNVSNGRICETISSSAWNTKNYTQVEIYRYAAAENHYAVSVARTGFPDTGVTFRDYLCRHVHTGTSAITSLTINASAGSLSGTIYLYGVK
jgi:hypothetical protein